MSRIGKLPVLIPDGVELTIDGNTVLAKGSQGDLSYTVSDLLKISKEDNQLLIGLKEETREAREQWGLNRTMVFNIIKGVSEGFEKRLSIHGVGFRAQADGSKLTLNLGFSHPLEVAIPETLSVKIEKNIIVISGSSKEQVGQFAADIRKLKKPEPYKGKGIRYIDERVRRKAGKTAK